MYSYNCGEVFCLIVHNILAEILIVDMVEAIAHVEEITENEKVHFSAAAAM